MAKILERAPAATICLMSQTAHTPGPWQLTHTDPTPDYEYPYMRLRAGDGGYGEPGFELTAIISKHDANLIAAAPDLLGYAKLMAANGDPDAIELVAKAEGRS